MAAGLKFVTFQFGIGEIKAARDTPEGFRRCYVRLAKADHPYEYFNQDGTKRIEIIQADDLFNPASVATAKGMPVLTGHPAFKLDSSTSSGAIAGAMGENFVRERTDAGEFLGVITTLYTDAAKQHAERSPGVSPGYRVKTERRDDSTFFQKSREYNHLAVGVVPRGGDEVRQMFEGIRVDSVEGSGLWIARQDGCYRSDFDEDFIDSVLMQRDRSDDLLEKTRIDLTEYVGPDASRHDKACDCDKCTAKTAAAKASAKTRGQGFGVPENEKKKKRMDTTDFVVDGVTYRDVPTTFAAAVQPKLSRLDGMADKIESLEDSLLEAQQAAEVHEGRADELQATYESLANAVEEGIESRADADEGYTEEEVLDTVKAYIGAVDQMRKDGELLLKMGRIDEFNMDGTFIAENISELQRDMLSIANPRMDGDRLDSMDEVSVTNAYEMAFSIRHDAAESRSDSSDQSMPGLLKLGQNMKSGRTDSRSTPKGPHLSAKAKKELEQQNAVFDMATQARSPVGARSFAVHGN